ncbi:hypothetical protein TWF281_001309 [Arthrobotrys megalospora]
MENSSPESNKDRLSRISIWLFPLTSKYALDTSLDIEDVLNIPQSPSSIFHLSPGTTPIATSPPIPIFDPLLSPDDENSIVPSTLQTATHSPESSSPPRDRQFQITQSRSRSKSHKGSTTYSCLICPISFTNRKVFGDHMRTNHDIHAFKCRYCDTQVTRHDNLKSHERRCKGLNPAATKRLAPTPSDVAKVEKRPTKHRKINVLDFGDGIEVVTPGVTASNAALNASEDNTPLHSVSNGGDDDPAVDSLTVEVSVLKEKLLKREEDLAVLRGEVDELKEERNVWKRQYIQLKLQSRPRAS